MDFPTLYLLQSVSAKEEETRGVRIEVSFTGRGFLQNCSQKSPDEKVCVIFGFPSFWWAGISFLGGAIKQGANSTANKLRKV